MKLVAVTGAVHIRALLAHFVGCGCAVWQGVYLSGDCLLDWQALVVGDADTRFTTEGVDQVELTQF